MCMQDQQMAQRATLKRAVINSAVGENALPDVSRALWFTLTDGFQAAILVHRGAGVGNADYLPRDTRFTTFAGQYATYSREQCGSAFMEPLYYGSAGGSVYLTYLEMDIGTYSAILNPDNE